MKYQLSEFEKRVEQGLVRAVRHNGLVLYNYTDKCVYDKCWDDYTRVSRGIIFEETTGDLIAFPFPKFFNLGEMPETEFKNLPLANGYTTTEKMDGSLGIIYWYNHKWNVATRGSFNSKQAMKAEELLQNYPIANMTKGCTYLVEIIYPENKIVVNYEDTEALILIGLYHVQKTQHIVTELFPSEHRKIFPVAQHKIHTIEEMIALQQTLPKDKEGFVVRFSNKLRVKIKGIEYLRIHKMVTCMSPLSFWESMKNGIVNKEYLQQLPEEFRTDFEPMVKSLESAYHTVYEEICFDLDSLYTILGPTPSLKDIGLMTQNANSKLKHPGAMFPYILKKNEALDKYIMKFIRPTGNSLKSID